MTKQQIPFLLVQALRLFAYAISEESLVLTEDLPPGSARAVYFVRHSSVLITSSNIQVCIPIYIHRHEVGDSKFARKLVCFACICKLMQNRAWHQHIKQFIHKHQVQH